MSAFSPLETARLRIRPFTPEDWPAVHAYTGDAATMHYVEAHPMDEARTRQFIAENLGDDAKHFAVALRDEGRLIGHLAFHPWFSTHTYEIGWVLHPRYHGQGYTTEAASAMLRHGFETLRLHRVIATCQPENPASWRVMEKLGMRREGHFRKGHILHAGTWWDEYFYAMLEEDWFGTGIGKKKREGDRGEPMTQDAKNIIAQVESLPELIRSEFETLDMRARRLLNHNECLSVKRIVIEGCGDSHMAGLAAELAFEQIAGIPTEPMTAMQAARYGSPAFEKMFPRNPLVIGISVSGTVARTREALALARKEGALTVAVTANPDAPLATAAELMFDCKIPDFVPAPGVRSYRVSLMVLYLLAIHLAEVNGRITQDQANDMRGQLKGTADAIAATIAAVSGPSRELAEAVKDQPNYVFVGDGPNYATALFSAAKVIEGAGRHAMGQDTEEWAHLQYFVNTDPATPTFLISPGRRGHPRMAELVEVMKRIGRTVVAVVPGDDTAVAGGADWTLPVVGDVPEVFSPMVYAVAGEIFSAHLSEAVGEPPFRAFSGAYNETAGNTIRTSAVIESVERG